MDRTRFVLGTFDAGEGPYPGLVVDEVVIDTRTVLPHASTAALLQDWDAVLPVLAAAAQAPAPGRPVSVLRVLPPVTPPGQIFGAGANYREHVVQMAVAHGLGRSGASPAELAADAGREIDERQAHGDPYVWSGVPSAISGAYDDVVLPDVGSDHDWELELGVVIGRRASNVSTAEALDHVAGYTICNDLTTRSLVPRTDIPMMGTDWLRAKNFPTFYPTGPWLVPARFVPDPLDLGIRLSLNGTTMQKSNTRDMIFGPAQLISYISRYAVLQPGDMVITGSPPGNGSHWGRFLQPGDVLEAEIDGLGTQRTRCVAAPTRTGGDRS
jgi:2-keto-4-pentenoate hydratase/2-oxohepta-3-ene-1,7-dioic acid hydratase in catechol pathway